MSQSTMNNRMQRKDDSSFSVAPVSLPSGCITVHYTILSQNPTSNSLKQYNLLEILCPRQDHHIVDHHWTTTTFTSIMNQGEINSEKRFTVLAVLGRIKIKGESEQKQGIEDGKIMSTKENKSHVGSVVSIYCREDSNHKTADKTQEPEPKPCQSDTESSNNKTLNMSSQNYILLHEIKIHAFPYSLALSPNALVVSSTYGAEVYSLRRLLFDSPRFQMEWTTIVSFKALHCNPPVLGNDDPSFLKWKWEQNRKQRLVNNKIHLMVSFPIHAMSIYSPFLAAASGDRIGVWNLDQIVSYLENTEIELAASNEKIEKVNSSKSGHTKKDKNDEGQKSEEKSTTTHKDFQNKKITFSGTLSNLSEDDVRAAVWSAKVDKCLERITFIDFKQTYLAFCCWDGTAFVFYPSQENNETTNQNKSPEPSYNQALVFRDVSSWTQYSPFGSSFTPEWEVPPLEGEDRQKTNNTPIFLSISSFSMFGPNSSFYDEKDWMSANLMVVSTPGSSIIRCFDLNTGSRCQNIGRKQDLGHDGSFIDGGAVHGMLSAKSKSSLIHTLHWVDHQDLIHSQVWPHFHSNENARILKFKSLLQCRHGFRIRISFENMSGTSSLVDDAWLKFHSSENMWKLDWGVSKKEGENKETKYNFECLPLPFLTDSDAMGLIIRSNDSCQKYDYVYWKRVTDRLSCQAIMTDDYIGILVPSLEIIYLFRFSTNSWEPIYLDDGLNITSEQSFYPSDDEISYSTEIKNNWEWMKSCFMASRYLLVAYYSHTDSNKTHPIQICVWDLNDDTSILCQKTLLLKKEFDLDDDISNKLNDILNTIQIRIIDNSNPLSIVVCCQSHNIHSNSGANGDVNTSYDTNRELHIWVLDLFDTKTEITQPRTVNIECFIMSNASSCGEVQLLGAQSLVAIEPLQFFYSSSPDLDTENTLESNHDSKKEVVLSFKCIRYGKQIIWSYFIYSDIWKRTHDTLNR